MMGHQPGLTLAVADLLAPIRLHGSAMVMPHERGRSEPDFPPTRLQTPADVDVVAGAEVNRIEAADREQRVALEGHIAARHVLRDAVVEQHVGRSARWARGELV